MFINTINPIIVQLGPLAIRWYSLPYIIGFLLAYWYLKREAAKSDIHLDEKGLDQLVTSLIIGVIVGGRVFDFVFYRPEIFWTNPLEILYIWHGGMSFHGGLIGGFLAAFFFCRKKGIPLMAIGDILVVPAALALAFGRIGNFINGELVGTITNVPWCVNFGNEINTFGELVCRHPVQLYATLKDLFIFGMLNWANTWQRSRGMLFWLFVTLYGWLRFFINFWRDDPLLFLGISMGQLLSLLMGIVGIIMLIRKYRK